MNTIYSQTRAHCSEKSHRLQINCSKQQEVAALALQGGLKKTKLMVILYYIIFMNLILKTNPFNKYVYPNQMGLMRGALELLSYNTA